MSRQPAVLRGFHTLGGHRLMHLGYRTPGPVPYTARLTVREACAARGVSVYQIAMSGHAQGTVDAGTVYRLARGDTARIDLGTLATVAGILHRLSGQPVAMGELLTLDMTGEAAKGERQEAP